jgi:uncharacterized protein
MNERYVDPIAKEMGLKPFQVRAVVALIEEGATVPFMARYRKEATGSLDEVAITDIKERLDRLRDLDARRESILKSLAERELLTDELKARIDQAETLTVLEDIYLPYRPKKRTRAAAAREKGLEPLAQSLFLQDESLDPLSLAAEFVDAEKGVAGADEALAGARDIIAEWVNESEEARGDIRRLFASEGVFRSRVIPGKEAEGAKFKDYFDWTEKLSEAPSHRVLAMLRGAAEDVLNLRVTAPEERALELLSSRFVKGKGACSREVAEAVCDGYRRLLSPSMETERRMEAKKEADKTAIRVFAENLRELLMAPPLGQKTVMAVDPGIRTGCKLVCLDRQGKLLHTDTVFPLLDETRRRAAAKIVADLCVKFEIEAVAVGNGTGGRETLSFLNSLGLPGGIFLTMVNESGASVYSASRTAREELPDQDVTVRGAVSIGRRLLDPLAELVKIDPKSIGVGQYQHDVDQRELKRALDDIVVSCVNAVGVDVNTASPSLLTYVSGLGPRLAKNVVAYRNEHGPYRARAELLKVPLLGPKAFEQSAGFMRIRAGSNPLDGSAVHPESYWVVESMASDLGCSIGELVGNDAALGKVRPKEYVTDRVGMPTIVDILDELGKPGRDPRKAFESFLFSEKAQKIEDLEPGMVLPGVVTNITAFGAFVDVGVHQDGLVHVSQLADRYVKDPHQVVKVHQKVDVTVLEVDLGRRRISLSMRKDAQAASKKGGAEKGGSKKNKEGASESRSRKREAFNSPFARLLKRE